MEPLGLDVFFLAPVAVRISGQYRSVVVAPDGSVFNAHNTFYGDGEDEPSQNIAQYTAEC